MGSSEGRPDKISTRAPGSPACMGLGFAWFAEEIIRPELDAKALVPLPMAEGGERWATLYLVYADSDHVGPAAKELARLLQSKSV